MLVDELTDARPVESGRSFRVRPCHPGVPRRGRARAVLDQLRSPPNPARPRPPRSALPGRDRHHVQTVASRRSPSEPRVRGLSPRQARGLDERPPQPDDPASEGSDRARRFLPIAVDAARQAVSPAVGGRRALHHRVVAHRQARRAPRRLHARQPPDSALPDHHRSRAHRRPAADLGCAATGVVRQRRHHPPRRRGRRTGPAVEQGLRRLSRQPAGQPLRARDAHLRHRMGGLRHVVRAVSWPGERARRAVDGRDAPPPHRRPSSGRHGWTRPRAAWCAPSAIRCATPWRRITAPARTTTTTSCPSSNIRRARSRTRSTGPMAGRAVLERRDRAVAEPMLPQGRRSRAPRATTRTGRTSIDIRSWRRPTTHCARVS